MPCWRHNELIACDNRYVVEQSRLFFVNGQKKIILLTEQSLERNNLFGNKKRQRWIERSPLSLTVVFLAKGG